MFKSNHVTLAASIVLGANLACAGPLDPLFSGEAKTAAATAAAPVPVKRLGDAEMSCERLYAEVKQLEAQLAKAQVDALVQSSSEAGKKVASGLAQGLISAAPLFGDGRGGTPREPVRAETLQGLGPEAMTARRSDARAL